ncbi:L-serine ammonia-lyase, iron-sulfur-dependent, subunit alpha [Persicobacter sp. CCB-QB2]|uniref:L-serine ammonia-lyase, iron-sulfur-dependent, subunit alpha n=1 Tax=Persicobacter sp. CCB-QB2 TaxID=1561025 RepID=UPI0006A96639|nr:L-serine ammonia-lyase, iron-sulfur-dependent, subunit alpha [Persicobacter sp. CCB-QB2]
MSLLFKDFKSWKAYCEEEKLPLYEAVIQYEQNQRGAGRKEILEGMVAAYEVMRQAIHTGLTEDMTSVSKMINNGAKKVFNHSVAVLSPDFQKMIARALAAKEVNSCMGRVVAAPTAGASGILPGVFYTLQETHELPDEKIAEAMLIAAGVALIIEQKASLAGAVGGCQAETGSAAAMASAGIVYALGGDNDQVFNAVAVTIQCMLGLVCDPVAGLVEVPCVVRNASAASIAFSSAQIALSGMDAVIPVDECIDAMHEVGQSMESRYKETALGGMAATITGQAIAKRVLIQDIEMLSDEEDVE